MNGTVTKEEVMLGDQPDHYTDEQIEEILLQYAVEGDLSDDMLQNYCSKYPLLRQDLKDLHLELSTEQKMALDENYQFTPEEQAKMSAAVDRAWDTFTKVVKGQ